LILGVTPIDTAAFAAGTAAQTITMAPTGTTTLGDSGAYNVDASTNDTDTGAMLVYNVDTTAPNSAGCKVDVDTAGNTDGDVSFTTTGNCTVDVNSAATGNYDAASQAQQVLTVNPNGIVTGFVAMSGQVTDSLGNPDTGVTVSFANYTTVTDTNGDYIFPYVGVNTSGALSFSGGSAVTSAGIAESAQIGTNGNGSFSVGTQDVTENLVWPAQTEVDVTALDSNGQPIAGLTMVDGGGNGLLETLSDGTTVVDFFQTPAQGENPVPPGATCVTDASGECPLPAMEGDYYLFVGGSAYYPFPGSVPVGANGGVFVTSDPTPLTLQYGPGSLPVTVNLSGSSHRLARESGHRGDRELRQLHGGHRCER
jgi:hypothetical protein